ncbi:ferredoxin [Gordonia sp. PKS22-38]|uniref:Ferredoxin n=1 Tax=Gordonia prachuapensis TaxID=3115651 RepID=A0ABU7MSW2_9ACTN|nr:ferredoxin [Gordonia sp. PKS22-38]
MKITIDQDKCIASGQCVAAADAVFDQRDDDGIAFLIDEDPPTSEADDVRHAAAVCPALAIVVED